MRVSEGSAGHGGRRRPLRALATQPREVVVLVAVAFAVALGFGVVAPAIPLFARELGVGRTAAGLVVSAFAAARLLSALSSGRLVDRLGPRRVLAAGIGVVAVSSAVAGLAQTYAQLVVLRGAGGVGSAMFTIAATTLLLRTVEPARRASASGLFQTGFLLGGIAGPAVGGLVTGISVRAPFFLYALTLAVAGAVGLALLPRDAPDRAAHAGGGGTDDDGPGLLAALRLPAYRAALVCWFSQSWTVFGVRAAVVPLYVTEGLREDPLWVGVGFSLSAALTAAFLVVGGRVADGRGRRPALLAGTAGSALGALGLAAGGGLVPYLVAMAVLGVGGGLLGPVPAAVVGDVAGGRRRGGTLVAAHSMAGDAGAVLGPAAGGALADGPGFGAAFLATAGVLAAGTAAAAVMPETLERPGGGERGRPGATAREDGGAPDPDGRPAPPPAS